ncbi:uncharacterized protein LOC113275204 isoform X1 [Papaver somniferum]|uniref:uncharacterized protein LOC113275204 isoform X1 n=1 Tax=Papaver somniferum TaxID=3469 RepID=UPI000E700F55|nr:uncharacterized protein LOC113275204 isoform X1 [Papaver somniferum]
MRRDLKPRVFCIPHFLLIMDPGNSSSAGPSSDSPPSYHEEKEIVWETKHDLFGKEDDSEDDKKKSTKDGKKKKAGDRGVPEGMVIFNAHRVRKNFPTDAMGIPVINPNIVYYVMIDGYYRKGRGGGFGAVLRCESGLPIAALAGVSETPVSGLYHVFQGMLAGFKLAHKKKVRYVIMSCNLDWAHWMMENCYNFYGQEKYPSHPGGEFDTFCIPYLKDTMGVHGDEFTLNHNIIKEIVLYRRRNLKGSIVVSGKRYFNQGADFLVKFLKGPGRKAKTFEPNEFPSGKLGEDQKKKYSHCQAHN